MIDSINAVRRFNRLCAPKMSSARAALAPSGLKRMELRVLRELERCPLGCNSAWIVSRLEIDPGQLSRILQSFVERRLISEHKVAYNRRLKGVVLTREGWGALAALELAADRAVAKMVAHLRTDEHCELVAAFETIERLLKLARPTAPARSTARSTPAPG